VVARSGTSSTEKNNDNLLGLLALLILLPVGAFVAYKLYFQKKAATSALAHKSLQPEVVPAAAAATVACAPAPAQVQV